MTFDHPLYKLKVKISKVTSSEVRIDYDVTAKAQQYLDEGYNSVAMEGDYVYYNGGQEFATTRKDSGDENVKLLTATIETSKLSSAPITSTSN